MPDYLRALVFVLALGGLTFAVTIKPLSVLAGRQRVLAWIGIWLALTLCFFLARNFWLISLVSAVVMLISIKWESDRTVLYLLAFCMVPVVSITVPGFGGIKNFMALAFQDYLALLLLIPLLLSGKVMKNEFAKAPGVIFLAYFFLVCILTFRETTFTDTLRAAFGLVLSMLVPFFAFSTNVNTEAKMRSVIHAMIFAALSLSLIGVFEFAKHWHVYEPAFGSWAYVGYLFRGGGLRASGPIFDPIAFGTVFMIGIGLFLALPKKLLSMGQQVILILLLLGGLMSPTSRGPWLGSCVILVVFLLTGPNPVGSLVKFATMGMISIFLLLLTPVSDGIINLLPYVGTEENTVTADYRAKLLENSWIVIQRNLLFGSVDYRETPEMQELINGEGIIDVVNTYLEVALKTGFVGLGLFLLFFAAVLAGLARAFRSLPEADSDLKLMSRALFATLCGVLVIIFTVSSVGQIPYFYWILAGLCVAQTRIIRAHIEASRLEIPTAQSERLPTAKPNAIRRPYAPVRRAPNKGGVFRG